MYFIPIVAVLLFAVFVYRHALRRRSRDSNLKAHQLAEFGFSVSTEFKPGQIPEVWLSIESLVRACSPSKSTRDDRRGVRLWAYKGAGAFQIDVVEYEHFVNKGNRIASCWHTIIVIARTDSDLDEQGRQTLLVAARDLQQRDADVVMATTPDGPRYVWCTPGKVDTERLMTSLVHLDNALISLS